MSGYRKFISLLFLSLLFSGQTLQASPKDFIVLLDTSKSMFDYQDQVVQVFFNDVLKEHLKLRDTFHLISFSEKPELEISQKIEDRSDAAKILKRLFLLQPLGEFTDLILGLNFTYQYAVSLPGNSQKTVVILTDGVQNTPKGSPKFNEQELSDQVLAQIKLMKQNGWDVRLIRIPALAKNQSGANTSTNNSAAAENKAHEGPGAKETRANLDSISDNLKLPLYDYDQNKAFSNVALGSPEVVFPADLGKIGTSFNLPLRIKNKTESKALLRIKEVLYQGENILKDRQSITLEIGEERDFFLSCQFQKNRPVSGKGELPIEITFDDDLRAFPTQATIAIDFSAGIESFTDILIWLVVLVALALAALVLYRILQNLYRQSKKIVDEERGASGAISSQTVSTSASTPVGYANISSFSGPTPTVSASANNLLKPADKGPVIVPVLSKEKNPSSISAVSLLSTSSKNSDSRDAGSLLAKSQELSVSKAVLPPVGNAGKPAISLSQLKKDVPANVVDHFGQFKQSSKTNALDLSLLKKKSGTLPDSNLKVEISSNHGNGGHGDLGTGSIRKPLTEKVTARPPVVESIEFVSKDFFMSVRSKDHLIQKTIEKKNVLSIKAGDSKTIGGGKSSFKINLVKLEEAIAEVYYDGKDLHFYPLKPDYFPSVQGELKDCLEKEILVKIPSERDLIIKFSHFMTNQDVINTLFRRD